METYIYQYQNSTIIAVAENIDDAIEKTKETVPDYVWQHIKDLTPKKIRYPVVFYIAENCLFEIFRPF